MSAMSKQTSFGYATTWTWRTTMIALVHRFCRSLYGRYICSWYFLIVVDAHSKWSEVILMHQATEEYAFNVHVTTQDFCNARTTITKRDRQWTAGCIAQIPNILDWQWYHTCSISPSYERGSRKIRLKKFQNEPQATTADYTSSQSIISSPGYC